MKKKEGSIQSGQEKNFVGIYCIHRVNKVTKTIPLRYGILDLYLTSRQVIHYLQYSNIMATDAALQK